MGKLAVTSLVGNSALLFCGGAIIAYGLYLQLGDEIFISIFRTGKFWACDNLLLLAGAFVATGGLVRLIGAYMTNRRMMLWSIIFTVLAFVCGLSLVIMVFGFYYEPKEYAVKAVAEQIKENYGEKGEGRNANKISSATKAIDDIQEKYKCCGANGYTDWQGSKWSIKTGLRVPKSCCNTTDYKICQSKSGNVSTIFQQNCSKELENWAVKHIPLIGSLGCILIILAICSGILTAFAIKHL